MLQDGFVFLVSDYQIGFHSLFWGEDLRLVLTLRSKKNFCDCVNIWMLGDELNPLFVSNLTFIWVDRETLRPLDKLREECVVEHPFEVVSTNMDRNV